MKKSLNVFFTIDKNYCTHFGVTVTSLLENNKDLDISIYLIHDLDDVSILDDVIDFIKKKYQTRITLLTLDNSILKTYRVSDHLSKAVYFRLFLPKIIPETVQSGLFMDCDIIVTGSLKHLADFDFTRSINDPNAADSQYYVFAVHEKYHAVADIEQLKEIGFHSNKYFNAGVMLINLEAWRSANVSNDLIAIAEKHMDKLRWWDQDVLNLYFQERWGKLDDKYNGMFLTEKLPQVPLIIHYSGAYKPWQYGNKHPYRSQYFYYLKKRKYKYLSPLLIFSYLRLSKIFSKAFTLKKQVSF